MRENGEMRTADANATEREVLRARKQELETSILKFSEQNAVTEDIGCMTFELRNVWRRYHILIARLIPQMMVRHAS